MRSFFLIALCALVSVLTATTLPAEEIFWKAPVTGTFNTAANWLPGQVPGANDTAIFDLGSAGYTVNVSASGAGRLRFDNDTVTLKGFQMFATDETQGAIQFGSNAGDVSNVFVQSSLLYGRQILIGVHEDATATVSLKGTLSTSEFFSGDTPDELIVGAAGQGTLLVEQGTVNTGGKLLVGRDSTSQGLISMSGGSLTALGTQLVVGQSGKGTLNVTGASRVDINGELLVGQEAGSEGAILVSGTHAQLGTPGYGNYRMTATTVGGGGSGSLAIAAGARARMEGPIVLGRDVGSEGSLSVDGINSSFEAYKRSTPPALDAGISVGMSGKGQLSITGGARAKLSGPIIVGQSAGAEGKVNIDGTATVVSNYGAGGADPLSLVVGDAGKGEATISGGAQFDGPIIVGNRATGEGKVTIDGAGTEVGTSLIAGNLGKGAATISNGAAVELLGTVILGNEASGDGSLAIQGADTHVTFNRTNIPEFDRVVVGAKGMGNLHVSQQAIADLRDATIQIAPELGAVGTAIVEGSDTELVADRVEIGGEGIGKLAISDQGQVRVWKSQSGKGIVEVRPGSSLELKSNGVLGDVSQPVTVNNAGTIDNTGGTIFGSVNNVAGGSIVGSGAISGALTQTGGVISPGNSPGTLDVGSLSFAGGTLVIEMNSALGVAGGPIGWDLISSHGMAALTGPLSLELVSLSLDNQPGDVFDFDPNRSKSWTIIQGATGGSSIYDPNLITIDTSGFSNEFAGRFSLSVRGASIALTYLRPLPEPETLVLAGLGVMGLFVARRLRSRDNAPSAMPPG